MTTMDATLFYSLIIIALIVTIVFISPLRLVFLTLPLYGLLKGRMPSISTTEREAIDAGTVWWEASLLRGKPNWHQLHQLGQPRLSRKEQNFVDKQTEQLCALCDDWAVQKQADLSKDVWTFIKKHRFFGMIIPEAYGGLGFSAAGHAAVITKLASRSPVLAVTVMVPNSLGPAELIMKYGTEQQKAHYLPRLARGDEIPCFALTSLKAGSDASAIEDKAVVCRGTYNGKACLGLRTTWEKRYITLAPVATVIGLAVKVYDPQGLLEPSLFNGKKELGITCLLVPAHLSGVRKGLRHSPLDVFFQNGPTSGTDVFLPFECIIGGKPAIGKGWQMLIECLAVGRSLSLPSLSNAVHQTSVYTSSLYTSLRYQFHRPIGTFEAVAHKLACMVLSSHVVRASSRLALAAIDAGNQPAVISAMLKYTSTERARCTLNHAMDIHGGKAIMQGPNNYLAHSYKSLPIMITVEGANTLTRALIVFGQGALRCHPYLYHELQCLTQSHRGGLFAFNRLVGGHMRYHVWLFFKTWFARWSGGWLLPIPKNARPPTEKCPPLSNNPPAKPRLRLHQRHPPAVFGRHIQKKRDALSPPRRLLGVTFSSLCRADSGANSGSGADDT